MEQESILLFTTMETRHSDMETLFPLKMCSIGAHVMALYHSLVLVLSIYVETYISSLSTLDFKPSSLLLSPTVILF